MGQRPLNTLVYTVALLLLQLNAVKIKTIHHNVNQTRVRLERMSGTHLSVSKGHFVIVKVTMSMIQY